jgi:hypothetical protein
MYLSLTMYPRLALTLQSFCLSLSSAGVISMHHPPGLGYELTMAPAVPPRLSILLSEGIYSFYPISCQRLKNLKINLVMSA